MIDLFDRTAVITGAGSGIGADVARLFSELNSNVVLIGKTEEKLKRICDSLKGDSKKVFYFVCDVTDELELQKVRSSILKITNKIDILVTCAAAPGASGDMLSTTFDDWRNVLSVDLDGVFISCKVFGADMIKNRYGRIVNMTSFHNIATYPNRVVYNAAKSGVEGLSRALAVEWGSYGITVNTVAPGPIRTPRTSGFLSQSPDIEDKMCKRTPNARIGEPEDVSSLIAFLVSHQAKHINGQQIIVDGGWTKSAWWGDYEKK